MANKPKRTGLGLYAALSVFLLAAAAGGLFLLPEDAAVEADIPVLETVADAPIAAAPRPAAPLPKTPSEPVSEVEEEITATVMPEVSMPPETDDVPVVAAAPVLVVEPLRGEVIAAFSVDTLLYSETMEDWRIHDGMDISADLGAAVMATSVGTVLTVAEDALMGTTVVIRHDDGYQTTYANLQAVPTVQEGERVSAGQVIGAVGTTAAAESAQSPHLHFSVSHDGDSVDPAEYLKR